MSKPKETYPFRTAYKGYLIIAGITGEIYVRKDAFENALCTCHSVSEAREQIDILPQSKRRF